MLAHHPADSFPLAREGKQLLLLKSLDHFPSLRRSVVLFVCREENTVIFHNHQPFFPKGKSHETISCPATCSAKHGDHAWATAFPIADTVSGVAQISQGSARSLDDHLGQIWYPKVSVYLFAAFLLVTARCLDWTLQLLSYS